MHVLRPEDPPQTCGRMDGRNTPCDNAPARPLLSCPDDRGHVPPAAAHETEAGGDYDILLQPAFWVAILFPSLPLVAGCVFVWLLVG
jgi:hypothetical protein